jgi:hypothetical protein
MRSVWCQKNVGYYFYILDTIFLFYYTLYIDIRLVSAIFPLGREVNHSS